MWLLTNILHKSSLRAPVEAPSCLYTFPEAVCFFRGGGGRAGKEASGGRALGGRKRVAGRLRYMRGGERSARLETEGLRGCAPGGGWRGRRQGEARPRGAAAVAGPRPAPTAGKGRRLCDTRPPRRPPRRAPPRALPTLGLALSLPCFQTGSARLPVTCRRVPGWSSEVPVSPRVAACGAPGSRVPGERPEGAGGRRVQVRGAGAGRARGRGAVTGRAPGAGGAGSPAPRSSPTCVHVPGCAPWAAFFPPPSPAPQGLLPNSAAAPPGRVPTGAGSARAPEAGASQAGCPRPEPPPPSPSRAGARAAALCSALVGLGSGLVLRRCPGRPGAERGSAGRWSPGSGRPAGGEPGGGRRAGAAASRLPAPPLPRRSAGVPAPCRVPWESPAAGTRGRGRCGRPAQRQRGARALRCCPRVPLLCLQLWLSEPGSRAETDGAF